ncbi:MAG: carbohydrate kinase family protein [Ktedonobacteraceae bacterium]
MIQPPSVVCAGILVADLFVPPLERLPAGGDLVVTEDFLVQPGGCAANTAISLAKLGVSVNVVGKVGTDIFGEAIERILQKCGVSTDALCRSSTHGTSKTVILPVIGEDRRYIHTIGANADFSVEDISVPLAMQAQVFALGGYCVLPGLDPQRTAMLLKNMKEKGIRTILDVVVPASSDHPTLDDLMPILPFVDVFMPNIEEAAILTGETDPGKQAELFLRAGCNIAIITRGEHGAFLMSTQETLVAPSFPVEVVDVSGAGDAFVAGFIVGLLEQWTLSDTLLFASLIGASACTHLGCTGGVFTRPEAKRYLHSHQLSVTSFKTV